MNLPQVITQAASMLFTPAGMLSLASGTVVGMLVGILPGLGSAAGISLLLPLTFFLPPADALIFYTTLYQAAEYGGSITAIAVAAPGAPNSAALILDGYELNKRGHAAKAFAYSLWSCIYGSAVSTIALIFVASIVAGFALLLGPAEYAMLGVFGLTAVAFLISDAPRRGLISVLLGVLLGTVGIDSVSGQPRFEFGQPLLSAGLPLAPLVIGIFAIPEAVAMMTQRYAPRASGVRLKRERIWLTAREFRSVLKPASIGSVLGFFLGLLPGMSAAIPPFLSWNVARGASKKPELFGHGSPEGIAAPEAANAAVMHSSLIPAFILGIPGTPSSAIILGAMMIVGLRPGPELMAQDPAIAYTVFLGLVVGTAFLWVLGLLSTNAWARLISLPAPLIGIAILLLCVVGAYAGRETVFDVGILLVFGALGIFMRRFGYSAPAVILGLILGPIVEENLRQSLIISQDNPLTFVSHPLALTFLLMSVVVIAAALLMRRRTRVVEREASSHDDVAGQEDGTTVVPETKHHPERPER